MNRRSFFSRMLGLAAAPFVAKAAPPDLVLESTPHDGPNVLFDEFVESEPPPVPRDLQGIALSENSVLLVQGPPDSLIEVQAREDGVYLRTNGGPWIKQPPFPEELWDGHVIGPRPV